MVVLYHETQVFSRRKLIVQSENLSELGLNRIEKLRRLNALREMMEKTKLRCCDALVAERNENGTRTNRDRYAFFAWQLCKQTWLGAAISPQLERILGKPTDRTQDNLG